MYFRRGENEVKIKNTTCEPASRCDWLKQLVVSHVAITPYC